MSHRGEDLDPWRRSGSSRVFRGILIAACIAAPLWLLVLGVWKEFW